jgi:hypothetical protein
MPFVALVAGRHERFSAQGSTLARGLDSPSVTTSPTWGHCAFEKHAVGRHGDDRSTHGSVQGLACCAKWVEGGPFSSLTGARDVRFFGFGQN